MLLTKQGYYKSVLQTAKAVANTLKTFQLLKIVLLCLSKVNKLNL